MQLICPQFYLPFYGWQNDQDKEVYIIIKPKNEFQGPQFTVFYQAKLKDHFYGHIYTVSLFCGCCNMLRERKGLLPLSIGTNNGNTNTQSLAIFPCLISLAKSQGFTISAAPNERLC